MKFSFKKDFCVWVVPSNDGRVRKVRFTLARAAVIAVLLVTLGAGMTYIAGDYARVQVLQAKRLFSIRRVTSERDSLKSEKQSLESRVRDLQQINSRVLAYEQSIRSRIDEIGNLIGIASKMGVIPVESADNSSSESDGGVGGLEVDCADQELCEHEMLQQDENATARIHEAASTGDLLERLDHYTTLLQRVPLGAPGNGHISSHYGYRRSPFSRRIRMHQGIDFSLPHGSEVHSTAEGVVNSIRRDATYGLMIDIVHSKNVYTRYAHLSNALVKEGDRVCRGQAIGLVGSTGRSTGPHLHYEVRVKKQPLNPMQLMLLARALDDSF